MPTDYLEVATQLWPSSSGGRREPAWITIRTSPTGFESLCDGAMMGRRLGGNRAIDNDE
jgi:hypothetical protein